jgi:N-acetylmuramoyl-L-alanine amidase
MTTFLLNSGHSIFTAGKHSPLIPPGVFEYEFNFDVVKRIRRKALDLGIDTVYINPRPDTENMTLSEIVRRVNNFYADNHDCVFMSIHANAAELKGDSKWSKANGAAVFIAKKASEESKRLARLLVKNVSDLAMLENRGVKRANYRVLAETECPAVLSENGFMTNHNDATKLSTPYWRDKIAIAHIWAMLDYCGRT